MKRDQRKRSEEAKSREAAIRRAFGFLLDPAEKLGKNPRRLLAAPTSTLARFQSEVETKFIRQGFAEEAIREVMRLFGPEELASLDQRFDEMVSAERRRLSAMPAGAQIFALLERAHKGVRNSPLALSPSPEAHRARVEGMLVGHHALDEARRYRGERRARALWAAAATVAESLHRPYVEELWKLWAYSMGRAPGKPPGDGNHGSIINELTAAMPDGAGSLFDADAAHVRNAVNHDTLRYDPSTRTITFNDRRWTQTVSLTDLDRRVEFSIQVAGHTFPYAMGVFMFETWFSGALPRLAELVGAIAVNDPTKLEVVASELEKAAVEIFTDIVAVHTQSKSPGVVRGQSPRDKSLG